MGRGRVDKCDYKQNGLILKLKNNGYNPTRLGLVANSKEIEETIKRIEKKSWF